MIDVRRVGHATFTTPDLDREVAYYSDVMGLIVTERDKNRAFLATRTGFEAIALERGDKPALTRLSFQVAPDADFAAYATRAVRRTASRASSGTAFRRARRGR